MSRLTWDLRRAIGFVQQGRSYAEVAALLGVSASAVVRYFKRHPSLPRSERRRRGQVPLRRCWGCYQPTRQPTCPRCGLTFEVA